MGLALVVYCLILIVEIVGLWGTRRWAEYLTFIESCVLLPYEIYELGKSVTALKVTGLILDLGDSALPDYRSPALRRPWWGQSLASGVRS